MRATQHSSRTNAEGKVHGRKHNDRNFDVSRADNIDQSRIMENLYWNCYDGNYTESEKDRKLAFSDLEMKVYEELFGEQLDATNRTYIANGHPERVKTMEQWMSQRMHAPEELVLQVGSVDQMPDRDLARTCLLDYVQRLQKWNTAHGSPMKILDVALHMDEAVPHIQLRRTWVWESDGMIRQGQEKALEAAGVPLPDPDKSPGRRNNRKMTFDSEMRSMLLDICHDHGLAVEREALPDARHGMDKSEMIREKHARAIAETERLRQEAAKMEVSAAVAKAMAEAPLESPKKLLLTDLVAIPAKDYETLQRRSEGLDAAMSDAAQLRHDMETERIQAAQDVQKAKKHAESIVQEAREEAGRIVGSARVEALLDGTQQKLDHYRKLEKRYPEAFRRMEEDLKKDRHRSGRQERNR